MTMLHATVSPGARLTVPWREDFNALGYVLSGTGYVGTERHPVRTGQLVVFGAARPTASGTADLVSVEAAPQQESRHPNLEILLLGGRPIREPIAWGGPFVMNTKQEVLQAFEDFQAGRLGTIPPQRA
jgi:redox-sensitive bicupin YhaK (pirin superfamily)